MRNREEADRAQFFVCGCVSVWVPGHLRRVANFKGPLEHPFLQVELGQDMAPGMGTIRSRSNKLMIRLFENSLESTVGFEFQDEKGSVVLIKGGDLIQLGIVFDSPHPSVNWADTPVGHAI